MSSNQISRIAGNMLGSVSNILEFFSNPAIEHRGDNPLACDFAFGNPQELPLPGYIAALQQALPPKNKDWFAYKMSEPQPVAEVVKTLYSWRGVRYDPKDIFLTTGAFAGLAAILGAILDPGDEVIFNSPPWFFYEPMIISNGCSPVRVRVNMETFDLDLEAISAALTPKTRAIIINSPNNPTGKIYPPETLGKLADVLDTAQRRNGRPIYLLSDEAYSRIIFNGKDYTSPTQYYPNSFLIYTYGKTLLTPGQRIGYIALPPEMNEKVHIRNAIFITQLVYGHAFPNALLQHALPELNKLSIDINHLREKRDFMVGALGEMGYQLHSPDGTFYLLPRSPIQDDLAFTNHLIAHNIFCLPGKVVEMPGYFRISLTASDDMIQRSLPGFQAAISKYQTS